MYKQVFSKITGTCILVICMTLSCKLESTLHSSLTKYPADGKSSGRIVFTRSFFDKTESLLPPQGDLSSIEIIKTEKKSGKAIVWFKSTLLPGKVMFTTSKGLKLHLTFYQISVDNDSDGFPDFCELDSESDRKAFADWLVRIAESQFLKRNYSWNKKERDCAGLVRFAYKEALRKHDKNWLDKSGIVLDKNLPDVKKFNYPELPFLKDRIFKIKRGSAKDLSSFGYFVDADNLLHLNTSFISKDIADACKGDVLFFRNDNNMKFSYHTMIMASEKGEKIFFIYHTGSAGEVKRVSLKYLKASKKFRPEKWNKYFLGIFRFLILE